MVENKVHAGLKYSPPKIRTVLVALDYEPSAQHVAETGYTVASALGASLVLMHVVADNVYYSTPEYSPVMGFTGFSSTDITGQVGMADLKVASQDYLNITKHHLGDDNIQTMVIEGDTPQSIIDAAIAVDAGMVVLGSHNRRGLDRMLMGSTAEDVLRKITIPLLVVPTRGKDNDGAL
ncbi:MAG: universal stress protein [Bacteroidales bacterium]|nr:universal stress protein [Bacteroidales bacterium]